MRSREGETVVSGTGTGSSGDCRPNGPQVLLVLQLLLLVPQLLQLLLLNVL
jgi:hypothetical protein